MFDWYFEIESLSLHNEKNLVLLHAETILMKIFRTNGLGVRQDWISSAYIRSVDHFMGYFKDKTDRAKSVKINKTKAIIERESTKNNT